MRQATGNSFRMVAALAAMAALALAALTTLSGCGGGGAGTGGGLPTGLLVQGSVQDEQGRAVSGIRIIVFSNGVSVASALSRSDGSFTIDIGSGTVPNSFKVDVSNRANEYYEVVGYGGRNVQGCAFNLPAPQGNIINVGVVTVYSQGTPPPPPHDICP
ncbi:MAG: hypothetical protein KatS3mg022_1966 [Armatimonadota bacterium]|nr:MAG: hypothetical protein KatS3mg022_1966 [Armatimonadota bacterium]GIV19630.1 MAG: hypothetical protein KatS3mg023_1381 [Armatimonadota bacterium]